MNNGTMRYKGYKGSMRLVAINERTYKWYGKILNTNDLITYEADTAKELIAVFSETVDEYIKDCEELDKE